MSDPDPSHDDDLCTGDEDCECLCPECREWTDPEIDRRTT